LSKDHFDPLFCDRAVLREVLGQITSLAEFYKNAGWDPRPYEQEAKRIHMRLIAVQMKIEEKDND